MQSSQRPFLPLFVLLAVGYWVAMFVLTHIPNVELPDVDFIDKILHCGGYAVLTFAIGGVLTIWRGYQSRLPIWIWTLAVTYGAIDEYTQTFVQNRSSDRLDLLADAIGAALGLLALHLGILFLRRQRTAAATLG